MEKQEILDILHEFEKEKNIRFLGIVENGPRIWGTAGIDSPHYVSAVYVSSREWYAKAAEEGKKHTPYGYRVNFADDQLCLIAADIALVTSQMKEGVPQAFEWFRSPCVLYSTPIWNRLTKRLEAAYDDRMVIRHFFCRAKNTNKVNKDKESLKCFSYAPILISLWCSKYVMENHTYPPTFSYDELMEMECEASEEVKQALRDYKNQLTESSSKTVIAPIPLIQDYINAEVARQKPIKEGIPVTPVKKPDLTSQFKEAALRELWGNREADGKKKKATGKKAGRSHGKK